MTNTIKNFQIPVENFDRAHKFYNTLMDYELAVMEYSGAKLGVFKFDHEAGGVGGSIIKSNDLTLSPNGTMVYLDMGNDLQPNLDRVVPAGGKILIPKTELGPGMGFFAIIIDTEGNKIGLYSIK